MLIAPAWRGHKAARSASRSRNIVNGVGLCRLGYRRLRHDAGRRLGPGLQNNRLGWLHSVRLRVSMEADLDSDQQRRGDEKEYGDRKERCVEGNHGGLTNDRPAQQADGGSAGCCGVHASLPPAWLPLSRAAR